MPVLVSTRDHLLIGNKYSINFGVYDKEKSSINGYFIYKYGYY